MVTQKKKWNKGKSRDKLNNRIYFDEETLDKLHKEVAKAKLITPNILSDRLKITVSCAKMGIEMLLAEKKIRPVVTHQALKVYTRDSAQE